jgi:hypothetical protein
VVAAAVVEDACRPPGWHWLLLLVLPLPLLLLLLLLAAMRGICCA